MSRAAGYYDEDIMKGLTAEWQKGSRAIHQILSKMKSPTGDLYLLSRMQALAAEGKMELRGTPARGWKEFEVKLKSFTGEEVPANTEGQ